jgi:hypothetical protein
MISSALAATMSFNKAYSGGAIGLSCGACLAKFQMSAFWQGDRPTLKDAPNRGLRS